jgi:murein DD-endopeptidase MepM/ murein hydrolase activator NlpD
LEIKFALKKLLWINFLILFALLFTTFPVSAQSETSGDQPVYIVQSGDTLSSIAVRFGTTEDELLTANNLSDANSLSAGQNLIIPGLEGISGTLVTSPVPYGDNLRTLSRRYRLSTDLLSHLNHITSPDELYAGVNLIIPQNDQSTLTGKVALAQDESLLEASIRSGINPWLVASANNLAGSASAQPSDLYYYPDADAPEGNGSISPAIVDVQISPLPLVQGRTVDILVETDQPVTLSGQLGDYTLHFFEDSSNHYSALQGIHAMIEPGLYPLTLQGVYGDNSSFSFQQMIVIESGNYIRDLPLTVDPTTIDPAIVKPEEEQILGITTQITPEKYWDGVFVSPAAYPDQFTSLFGRRRSFNGSDYIYFHAGVDYAGGTGLPIKAPAPGVVVFTGLLNVRGNATIIDHGRGVFTGYFHQSEIDVKVGDKVETGQVIGLVGGTGRVTGAHLHWELWVNGVQVDPLDWLDITYP